MLNIKEIVRVGQGVRFTSWGATYHGEIVAVGADSACASVSEQGYPNMAPRLILLPFLGAMPVTDLTILDSPEQDDEDDGSIGALAKMKAWAYEGIPASATPEQTASLRRLNGLVQAASLPEHCKVFGFATNRECGYFAAVDFIDSTGAKRTERFYLTCEDCTRSDDEIRAMIEKTCMGLSRC